MSKHKESPEDDNPTSRRKWYARFFGANAVASAGVTETTKGTSFDPFSKMGLFISTHSISANYGTYHRTWTVRRPNEARTNSVSESFPLSLNLDDGLWPEGTLMILGNHDSDSVTVRRRGHADSPGDIKVEEFSIPNLSDWSTIRAESSLLERPKSGTLQVDTGSAHFVKFVDPIDRIPEQVLDQDMMLEIIDSTTANREFHLARRAIEAISAYEEAGRVTNS